jgi:predicted RNase H-like nuclease (RuvC/YqgF family)
MDMHADLLESPVAERITRLEAHVENIRDDITDMKAGMQRMDQKIDTLRDSLFEFRLSMERSLWRLTHWGVALHATLAATLLGVMAKGFGWIR